MLKCKKSYILVLLSHLGYHRILELQEIFKGHLTQFNTVVCPIIFSPVDHCALAKTPAKAFKQIYFHTYPFPIHSPSAASRNFSTSESDHATLCLKLSEGFHLQTPWPGSCQPLTTAFTSKCIPYCHTGTFLFLNPEPLWLLFLVPNSILFIRPSKTSFIQLMLQMSA